MNGIRSFNLLLLVFSILQVLRPPRGKKAGFSGEILPFVVY